MPELPAQPEPGFSQDSSRLGDSSLPKDLSQELALHEIGELLVATVISVEREARHYPSELGYFQPSIFEVELPVKLHVDDLGQLRAEIVNKVTNNDAVARIRLSMSHSALQAKTLPTASLSLKKFGQLTDEQITILEKYRVFSGEDLRRVTRTVVGYESIQRIIGRQKLDGLLTTVELVSTSELSLELSSALIQADIKSRNDLLNRPSKEIASKLSTILGNEISVKVIDDLKLHLKSRIQA